MSQDCIVSKVTGHGLNNRRSVSKWRYW